MSKTSNPQGLLLNLTDKIDYIVLSNLSIYKKSYKNNKFTISVPTWNEEFELPNGSYYIPDIPDYSEYIFKKHEEKKVNPSTKIYINKIENRITIKNKKGYYLKL